MSSQFALNFRDKLAELTWNSKPKINALTMLASEHREFAQTVVELVVMQIKALPCDNRLPVIYLMDSILKNVKQEYIPLFRPHLEDLVFSSYRDASDAVRASLIKLVATWGTGVVGLSSSEVTSIKETLTRYNDSPPSPPASEGYAFVNPRFQAGAGGGAAVAAQRDRGRRSPSPSPSPPPPPRQAIKRQASPQARDAGYEHRDERVYYDRGAAAGGRSPGRSSAEVLADYYDSDPERDYDRERQSPDRDRGDYMRKRARLDPVRDRDQDRGRDDYYYSDRDSYYRDDRDRYERDFHARERERDRDYRMRYEKYDEYDRSERSERPGARRSREADIVRADPRGQRERERELRSASHAYYESGGSGPEADGAGGRLATIFRQLEVELMDRPDILPLFQQVQAKGIENITQKDIDQIIAAESRPPRSAPPRRPAPVAPRHAATPTMRPPYERVERPPFPYDMMYDSRTRRGIAPPLEPAPRESALQRPLLPLLPTPPPGQGLLPTPANAKLLPPQNAPPLPHHPHSLPHSLPPHNPHFPHPPHPLPSPYPQPHAPLPRPAPPHLSHPPHHTVPVYGATTATTSTAGRENDAAVVPPAPPPAPEPLLTPDGLRNNGIYQQTCARLYRFKQCSNCGERQETDQQMEKHKDWHYRIAFALSQRTKSSASQPWLLNRTEWTDLDEDLNLPKTAAPTASPTEVEEESQAPQPFVEADETQKQCAICREVFESVWNDDEDSWVYPNTTRVADNGEESANSEQEAYAGRIVHVHCYTSLAVETEVPPDTDISSKTEVTETAGLKSEGDMDGQEQEGEWEGEGEGEGEGDREGGEEGGGVKVEDAAGWDKVKLEQAGTAEGGEGDSLAAGLANGGREQDAEAEAGPACSQT